MATEVILPRVDMDMTSGKFSRWLVREGQLVSKGDPLFEIETDKAAMEVEAPASGVARALAAEAGDELPVGAIVGWIFAPDEPYDQSSPRPKQSALPAAAPEPVRAAPAKALPADAMGARRATPLARAIARRRGLALSRLDGTGPEGRIQARDVLAPIAAAPYRDGALHRLWLSRGQGAPLVFLHGFGADLNAWRPVIGALTRVRPILALDLPGHGKSPPLGVVDFETMLEAVRSALADETISAAHVVGHSLGGAIAAAVAATSSLARSLTLIASAGLGPEINGAFLVGFLNARSEASLAPWMKLLATDQTTLGSALIKTTLRQRADLGLDVAQQRIAAALFPDGAQAFSIRPHLDGLSVPTKVVFGLDDRIIPARHAKGLPGAVAVHLFAGVGHMPHIEARAAVARLIEEAAAAGEGLGR
jgi:pimeloyl-ACP methyl ester carboxylesterase